MRFTWETIRSRAAAFAKEWANDSYESGEAQSFYNEFFEIFGARRRGAASFEARVKLAGARNGRIDLFWPGLFLAEHKSAGADMISARQQAIDYLPGIKNTELPRYILVCDFQTFDITDLETGDRALFALSDLHKHVERFGFIVGVEKRVFKDQDPANILAAELMGKLHDALRDGGFEGHPLERLLVRLLFCLFADDTGIFTRGSFEDYVRERTEDDGSDLGPKLNLFFQVLNTPENAQWRRTVESDMRDFPYINGDLFAEMLPIANFNAAMRERLLEACGFHWETISPAIFGSLFQSVMDSKERRRQGAHYTTERNILKVIAPLFLDDLRAEFARIKELRRDRDARLRAFQDKLATLKFLDPACGCGNFLVIAYRELRALELELLTELHTGKQLVLDVAALSKLSVEQFYGIEISEFPARIAEVALWMMDHIMNVKLSLQFGESYARIPLKQSPHIAHGDALELEWGGVLPPEQCSFVMGNPPFIGAKMQSKEQRAQVLRIADLEGSGGTLDYVAAWFVKAGAYAQAGAGPIAFVATNSITQGEQVSQLWPVLFDRFGLEIAFAHRTFAWGSEARGVAHVHVVVIGLVCRANEPMEKRLFSYENINLDPVESRHGSLSPYLFDSSRLGNRHLVIVETSSPDGEAPSIRYGSQPIDGGHLIVDRTTRDRIVASYPSLAPYLRPFVGALEFLRGGDRWIFVLHDAPPSVLKLSEVADRLKAVKEFRLKSVRPATRELADYPATFHFTSLPESPFLIIPEVSSERRDYAPIAYASPPTVPSNLVRIIERADLWHFGVLTSRMHMAWLRFIGGRLKSDYRYSIGIVYNTFPWPEAGEAQREKIRALAQAVLDARALFPGATLADLYDADLMKPELRKAHRDLDSAIDRLYRREVFDSDRTRVEHLFSLYETLAAPLIAASRAKRGRGRNGGEGRP